MRLFLVNYPSHHRRLYFFSYHTVYLALVLLLECGHHQVVLKRKRINKC